MDITYEKKINDNFSSTLNSTRLTELGHANSIKII